MTDNFTDRRANDIANQQLEKLAEVMSEAVKTGRGGGHDGGSDKRLDRLERNFDALQAEVTRGFTSGASETAAVRERLAKLETKVEHLPSKGFIVTAITTGVAVTGGILLIFGRLGLLAATAVN